MILNETWFVLIKFIVRIMLLLTLTILIDNNIEINHFLSSFWKLGFNNFFSKWNNYSIGFCFLSNSLGSNLIILNLSFAIRVEYSHIVVAGTCMSQKIERTLENGNSMSTFWMATTSCLSICPEWYSLFFCYIYLAANKPHFLVYSGTLHCFIIKTLLQSFFDFYFLLPSKTILCNKSFCFFI